MSQPMMESKSLSKDGSVLGSEPLMVNYVCQELACSSSACGGTRSSDEGLEAIMKRAPICPGKQNATSTVPWLAAILTPEPTSLRAKLAVVESNYSAISTQDAGSENMNGQMRNGAALPSHFRPTSPSSGPMLDQISSPRSSSSSSIVTMGVGYTESLPNAYTERSHAYTSSCADFDSLGVHQPTDESEMDASSEPAHERLCLSPTQERRSLSMSTNRPIVSRNHSALKGSCGSSPFRDASCGSSSVKKFHRTKSSGNDLTDSLQDHDDRLKPIPISFVD